MDLHLAGKSVLVARSAEKLAAVEKHLADVHQAAVSTLSIDIADLFVYPASERPSSTGGRVLAVDGGLRRRR